MQPIDLSALSETITHYLLAGSRPGDSASATAAQAMAEAIERRRAYRCAVTGPRRECTLRIADREIAAEMLDESANGFAVLPSEAVECQVGGIVRLKTTSGWTEAEIVHIQFPLPESGVPSSEGQQAAAPPRLGLMRIRDLEASEVDPHMTAQISWTNLREVLRHFSELLPPLGYVVGLSIGTLLVFYVVFVLLESSAPMLADTDGADPRPQAPALDPAPPPPVVHPTPKKYAPAPRQERPPANIRPERTLAKARSLLGDPEALLRPELAKALALTSDQAARLRQIIDDHQAFAKNLEVSSDDVESSSKLADRLRERCVNILTQEQRAALVYHLSQQDAATHSKPTDDTVPETDGNE